jgi:pimeloyl-ACP methyl ester carboxylesterase
MPSTRARSTQLAAVEGMVMGSGPPLVLLPGLAPENGRPTGLARNGELQTMAAYAREFTVYWIGRPAALKRGTTFAELASAIADGIRAEFDQPVRVLGISTGGSLGQQLAADHPELVDRLVLLSSGCRLDGRGATTQREMIEIAARGKPRTVMAAFARDVIPAWRGRTLAAASMYLLGLRLYPGARDTNDLLVTLEAEDRFDLRELPTITAPTLIVNGGRDQFYGAGIVKETHSLIPGSRLSVYPRRGHITVASDKAAIAEITAFLR